MSQIISLYNTNKAVFNSTVILNRSLGNLNEMKEKIYDSKKSRQLLMLFDNIHFQYINILKINFDPYAGPERNLTRLGWERKISHLRSLELKISLRLFQEQLLPNFPTCQLLTSLKINIFMVRSEEKSSMDISQFPKTLTDLTIQNSLPLSFYISHKSIKNLSLSFCSSTSILNIDECPKTEKFHFDLFVGKIICTKERIFKQFDIRSTLKNFLDTSNAENVFIYDKKLKDISHAFDFSETNEKYYEFSTFFQRPTKINDKKTIIMRTTEFNKEFYRQRPYIDTIEIKHELECSQNEEDILENNGIKKISCHYSQFKILKYFEKLEELEIDFDCLKPCKERFFRYIEGRNLKISFLNNTGLIFYDPYLEKNYKNIQEIKNPNFRIRISENIVSFFNFIDLMNINNFSINLDNYEDVFKYDAIFEKFNAAVFRMKRKCGDQVFFSRKPFPSVKIFDFCLEEASFIASKNCNFLEFENVKISSSDICLKFLRKAVFNKCVFSNFVSLNSSNELEIYNCTKTDEKLLILLPYNLKKVDINISFERNFYKSDGKNIIQRERKQQTEKILQAFPSIENFYIFNERIKNDDREEIIVLGNRLLTIF